MSSTRCWAFRQAAGWPSPIPKSPKTQARAIFEAAVEAARMTGKPVIPEIMVPLVAMTEPELDLVKGRIDAMAKAVANETGTEVACEVGTMIELPRAALRAAEIAESAAFFSFGTNDLTQTTLGISRDDAASFLGRLPPRAFCPPILSSPSIRRGWANSCCWRSSAAPDAPDIKLGILRRAWRRSGINPVFRARRARLHLAPALPGADRAAGNSPGRARRQGGQPGMSATRTEIWFGIDTAGVAIIRWPHRP
jgi:hypothetical protein